MAHDFVVPQLPGGAGAAGHGDAADHRHRRHHGRAVAAVLPAELRHRQADHPAVHQLREGRPVDRHRHRGHRRGRDDGRHRRRFRRHTQASGISPTPPAWRTASRPTAGRVAGVLFAIALLDASIIGAFAVSLSTAYAIGDVLGLKHSLHRGVKGAKGFYAVYVGLIAAGRGDRADPRLAARAADRGRADAGRACCCRPPRCSCCCCATTARCSARGSTAAGPTCSPGGGGRPGHAVGDPDRIGAVPGDHLGGRSWPSWPAAVGPRCSPLATP